MDSLSGEGENYCERETIPVGMAANLTGQFVVLNIDFVNWPGRASAEGGIVPI